MDGNAKSCFDLNKHTKVLAIEFDFADRLHSMARQIAAERTWAAISRFYDNCRTGEKKIKRSQRLVCRKVKGSNNRRNARTELGKVHLKISRQPYCTKP